MCEKIEPCETTRPPNPTLKAETGVRIPLGPPFDARGKLSGESFPRLLMAGHLRLESRFSRVEWCPERATEVPRACRGEGASRRASCATMRSTALLVYFSLALLWLSLEESGRS